MKRGKKYKKITQDLDRSASYTLQQGIKKIKTLSYSKFPGTLELHIDLKIPKDKDPKSLKGAVSLPNATNTKNIKVAVFCTPDKEEEAKSAGADFVGLDSLIKEIKENGPHFDVAIATPSVMPKIAVLGKELGPKGLMPNPKNGTVTENISKAVSEYKKGKQTFACDPSGVVHMAVGSLDMEDQKLEENIHTAISAISEVVGKSYDQIIQRMYICPTMGPSIKINYSR
ncbi:MAG TPA: 50S ribosomal protein L1 [Candidatus Dojkabacteria bacterium]|nr:50S ribosomal protein L1 [Candidatus Dojkabacteria bacterium]